MSSPNLAKLVSISETLRKAQKFVVMRQTGCQDWQRWIRYVPMREVYAQNGRGPFLFWESRIGAKSYA